MIELSHYGTAHKDSHKSKDILPQTKYPYQLTLEVEDKNEILFAEEQLLKSGGKEGLDFEWRESIAGKWSLWTLRGGANL